MTSSSASTQRTILAATLASAAMIGQQVGGKAARDAFFLSQFDISVLPTMIVVSALVSIVAVRSVMGRSPAWLLPGGFAASGFLLLAQWGLAASQPRLVAIALYLHVAVFGSVLISGFWSLVTERLDPYTARQRMGQIATGASVGAVLGGLLAERVGALSTVTALFPLLAGLHLACAVLVLPLRPSKATTLSEEPPVEASGVRAGLRVFGRVPYLRHLGYLVFFGAVSAALVDFVFKAEVARSLARGEAMMRFFAVYYTVLGIATLLVQSALSRRFLERLGLAPTVATLPGTVVVGSLGMVLAPGLVPALIARGAEAVVRSSLFRSGYELFYSPVSPPDKRATKTVIDVLCERLGDAAGGVAAKVLLTLVPVVARSAILALAAMLGGIGLWICHKLHRGYVEALEASLRGREQQVKTRLDPGAAGSILSGPSPLPLQSVLFTIEGGLGTTLREIGPADSPPPPVGSSIGATKGQGESSERTPHDPVADRLARLRSPDPRQVRQALRRSPLEAQLVPQVIELLARDDVAAEAAAALASLGAKICGQLGDALVDPDSDFPTRRRIARVLGASRSERAGAPLLDGLRDRRFEVRFRCGRALVSLRSENVSLPLTEKEVYAIVLEEVKVDRPIWESQSQLDPADEDDTGFDQLLRRRAHRRLEHVFTLLSVTLPRKPLKIAFRGLHTEDEHLRGTALEYLGSVLPTEIREQLWPHLTATPTEHFLATSTRSRQEIVADLMRSSEAIVSSLEKSRESDRDS